MIDNNNKMIFFKLNLAENSFNQDVIMKIFLEKKEDVLNK